MLMDTVQEPIDWKLNQRHADAESEVKTFVQNLIRGRLEHWRGVSLSAPAYYILPPAV